MIMMIKENDNCYKLLMQNPKNPTEFGEISKLTKLDYDRMLTWVKKIRNDNKKDAWYQFPSTDYRVFTITRWIQRDDDDYIISGNFGSVILSEMIGVEMDMMIFELECLVNHQCGTPAYFPPAKDKEND